MIDIIQKRLDGYKSTNPVEEEQAIKEIIQEVALYARWRAGFFEVAAFQGGTSLRILYGLPRFLERSFSKALLSCQNFKIWCSLAMKSQGDWTFLNIDASTPKLYG